MPNKFQKSIASPDLPLFSDLIYLILVTTYVSLVELFFLLQFWLVSLVSIH